LRVALTAAPQASRNCASRAGLNCALRSCDAFHVVHREQPAQLVLVIHHEQLVDAGMLGEKPVGPRNRVLA
jgi:hypothetical protein